MPPSCRQIRAFGPRRSLFPPTSSSPISTPPRSIRKLGSPAPPSLGGHPGFAGNPNTNINPFTLAGAGVSNGMSVGGFTGADGGGTGLASHAAQLGFARGAQMQQQQLHQGHDGRLALDSKAGAVKSRIRDVWKHNLAHEMAVLRSLVDKYPYISMVSRHASCDIQYTLLRSPDYGW